ncbi:hypothetical protein ACTWP5_26110 [Streptomyces sp. 4N509B]|uniref:hypothetical protein n=1 Tax=Streptomyces sp. 4N509B TaxID=3457413 RepID=UPI003FD22286
MSPRSSASPGRTRRAAGSVGSAGLLAVMAVTGTLACDLQRAVDCAQLALEVTTSADSLENALSTEALGDDVDALDELSEDVGELQDRVGDTDVQEAADSVVEAAENLTRAVEEGEVPDLTPLADATSELTTVCASAPEDS